LRQVTASCAVQWGTSSRFIEQHLPAEQFELLKTVEQSERDTIMWLVEGKIAGKRPPL
jgi:hypothetical protein